MCIQERTWENTVVLTITGNLISPHDVQLFKAHIDNLVQKKTTRVVVDLSGVKWLGAAMLGALTLGLKALRRAGGDLWLAGVSKKIRWILKVAGLCEAFEIMDTVGLAVLGLEIFLATPEEGVQNLAPVGPNLPTSGTFRGVPVLLSA